jgi:hypothetical protein
VWWFGNECGAIVTRFDEVLEQLKCIPRDGPIRINQASINIVSWFGSEFCASQRKDS